MAKYFYTDASGNRRGPFSVEQIKQLVMYKHIPPTTLLETDDGNKTHAGDIPGLGEIPNMKFYSDTQPTSQGPSLDFLDIGFTRFITNTWISLIWIFTIVAHIIGYVAFLILLFSSAGGESLKVGGFFVLTIGMLLSLLFSRMSLETIIVLFRIETHLRAIRDHYENK